MNLRTLSFPASLLVAGFLGTAGAFAQAVYTNTSTQKETPFTTSGTLRPFNVIGSVTVSPNYVHQFVKDGEPCAKSFWDESSYNGTRATKGAECNSTLEIREEGWMGFQFMLPTGGYPTNKEAAIAQIFSKGESCDTGGTWSALVVVKNNQLILRYRRSNGCTTQIDEVLASDIQRDAWKTVILHFRASKNNTGALQGWYGGTEGSPAVSISGLNFSGDTWTGDSLSSGGTNYIELKFGQYAFDNANYTNGETRIVYYDDVSFLSGNPSNAFDLVDPR